jgi:hypothetical protein
MAEGTRDKDEQSGFKVSDKRHFTSDGDVIEGGTATEETAPPTPSEPPAEAAPEQPRQPEPQDPPAAQPADDELPPGADDKVDFTHLVMSLAGTAYHALGMPDPVTKQKGAVNLPAVSQMIDLLTVLDDKTKGNLSPQEEQVLTGILTELRGLYVQASGFTA